MGNGPRHSLTAFVAACREGRVVVLGDAERDARQHFRLKTKAELLTFIGNEGLEEVEFINCKEWEKSRIAGRIVDAYRFFSGETAGYVAFCWCNQMSKWFLKSFHPDGSPTRFRNFALQDQIAKLLGR
jgi:hypothetical protein